MGPKSKKRTQWNFLTQSGGVASGRRASKAYQCAAGITDDISRDGDAAAGACQEAAGRDHQFRLRASSLATPAGAFHCEHQQALISEAPPYQGITRTPADLISAARLSRVANIARAMIT